MSRVFDAPLSEVSGACFAGQRLVIVGDADPVVAWTTWADGPGAWETLDVAELPDAPADTGQFEAVEHLRDDIVMILCEEPALLVAVDLAERRIAGTWRLRVDLKDLAKPWRKDPNSHGEGFFFGADRLFVVKEKKPAAIVEFGAEGQPAVGYTPGEWQPTGAPLTALGWEELDLDDVSDTCVVEGQVWLLSDKARCVQQLGGARQPLPAGIDKPEGLARTPDGRWLVAVDNHDGKDALFVVDLA